MAEKFRLHYAPDNASLIVRLALEELGVPYEAALVDRSVNAQQSKGYRAIHPNGVIPALETPDGPIFETGAILLWLADRTGRLAPGPDSPDRAGFLKWLFFFSNTLHPALRMTFYPDKFIGPDKDRQNDLRSHMQGELSRLTDLVEAAAAKTPPWLGQPAPGMLDFYMACLLRWMALYPKGQTDWFDLGRWPHLQAIAARLEPCESVQSAIDAEGLGPHPFTAPRYASPPEGSAT